MSVVYVSPPSTSITYGEPCLVGFACLFVLAGDFVFANVVCVCVIVYPLHLNVYLQRGSCRWGKDRVEICVVVSVCVSGRIL